MLARRPINRVLRRMSSAKSPVPCAARPLQHEKSAPHRAACLLRSVHRSTHRSFGLSRGRHLGRHISPLDCLQAPDTPPLTLGGEGLGGSWQEIGTLTSNAPPLLTDRGRPSPDHRGPWLRHTRRRLTDRFLVSRRTIYNTRCKAQGAPGAGLNGESARSLNFYRTSPASLSLLSDRSSRL